MALDPIAALPAVASAAFIYRVSVEAAVLRVYLPILLLLPDSFGWGWPAMTFHQYAVIPIGLTLCWWVLNGRWRWSWIDVAVFAYIGWMIAADIHANGMEDIVKKIETPITLALFPYMVGKLVIEQGGLRVSLARRFIFLVFVDAMISVLEFRFGFNPFRWLLSNVFSSGDSWFTQIRYGVGRISGPFGHAIFMGSVVGIAVMLHLYLMHFGLWEQRFRWLRNTRINKQKIILWGLVAGSLMTISRGPWLALIVGILIASVGTADDRRKAFRRNLLLLVAGGTLLFVSAKAYVASAQARASQEEIASAEYRTHLVDQYARIAMVQKVWGWGTADWPKVPGMSSIDNWYLLVMLMYGVTGVVLFGLMLAVSAQQLIWAGMFSPELSRDQRALAFTLCGIIVSVGVSVATVYLAGQLFPMLFLFLGWGQACLVQRPRAAAVAPAFAFRRVIA